MEMSDVIPAKSVLTLRSRVVFSDFLYTPDLGDSIWCKNDVRLLLSHSSPFCSVLFRDLASFLELASPPKIPDYSSDSHSFTIPKYI